MSGALYGLAWATSPRMRPSASVQRVWRLPTADRFPHVARCGSWADEPAQLRSAARRGSDKTWIKRDPQRPQSIWWLTDAEIVGFRVLRPLEEYDTLKHLKSKVTRDSK